MRLATDYLSKPADANDITNTLLASEEVKPPPPDNPMSADRVRWEHIQRVFELCDRNVSETARRLNMHRRMKYKENLRFSINLHDRLSLNSRTSNCLVFSVLPSGLVALRKSVF